MSLNKFMSRFGELVIGVVILGGSIYAYYAMTGQENGTGSKRQRSAPTVMINTLKTKELITDIEALGTGLAKESVSLSTNAQEKVINIHFDDGMYVEKDFVLVELENDEEIAELHQAQVNLSEQKRELERIEPLYRANVVSSKDYDERKSAYDRAQTLLAIVKAKLNNRIVSAPFAGELGRRMVSLGDLVSPGTLITTLDDISEIKVDFHIPEKYFSLIKVGQQFAVTNVAYPDREFTGQISMISVRLNNVTKSVDVRGIIPNVKDEAGHFLLRPGMLFIVNLELGTHSAVMIPEKAIMSLGEMQFIFIYRNDNTVQRREVKLGQRTGGMVEILEGAEAGERYVIEGVSKLADGDTVIVSNDERYRKNALASEVNLRDTSTEEN